MSKILEFLNEKIERTEKKMYTTMSPEKLESRMEEKGMSKEEFKKEIEELLKENKIFYLKTGEEKIAYDGNYKFDEDLPNRKWFVDKEKFNEVAKIDREYKNKINEREAMKLSEKSEKVKNLSENAQKIFSAINTITKNGEEKAYVNTKDLLKETGLKFEEFKDATKELSNNKITYSIKISKSYEIENNGIKESKSETAYVYTNKNSVLARVLKREEIKEEILENKDKNKTVVETKNIDKNLEENLKEKNNNEKKRIPKKKKNKEENQR